jgi:hypothetical protein
MFYERNCNEKRFFEEKNKFQVGKTVTVFQF